MPGQRDITLDSLRGVGILAVLIGHYGLPSPFEEFIYVWHMPLFFIVSGFLFKPKSNIKVIKNGFSRLIIPYLLTATIIAVVRFLSSGLNVLILRDGLISILVASGSPNNPTCLSHYQVGAIWFLPALFWTQFFFNVITNFSKRNESRQFLTQAIVCVVLSLIAVIVGGFIYVPFDILQGISAVVFFYTGYIFREYKLFDKPCDLFITLGGAVLVIYSAHLGIMEMSSNYYPCFIINVLAGTGFSYFLYKFIRYVYSKKIKACFFIYRISCYLGVCSLLILCVHAVEMNLNCSFDFPPSIPHPLARFLTYIIRLVFTLLVVDILSITTPIKKLFHIKKSFNYEV